MNWWEGNVTMGFGGNLFAGNTGGAEYSLTPRGPLRWVHPTGNSVWSNAAIGDGHGAVVVERPLAQLCDAGQVHQRAGPAPVEVDVDHDVGAPGDGDDVGALGPQVESLLPRRRLQEVHQRSSPLHHRFSWRKQPPGGSGKRATGSVTINGPCDAGVSV